MRTFLAALSIALAMVLAVPAMTWSPGASAQQLQRKEGWYHALADYDFVRENVAIPPKPKGWRRRYCGSRRACSKACIFWPSPASSKAGLAPRWRR